MGQPRYRFAERRKLVGLSQEALAEQAGVHRSTVVRWEAGAYGPQPCFRPQVARALGLTVEELDELLCGGMGNAATVVPGARLEGDDMNRRELLRLFSVAGAAIALPPAMDVDRLVAGTERPTSMDSGLLDEYGQLNSHLWRVFALASSKRDIMPVVRQQLNVLTAGLAEPQGSAARERLCRLAADLFQLAGEVCFDGDQYTDAAHCYTLAATAGREASAFDLWACAMTRQAFIAIYERRFAEAATTLEVASTIAARGDRQLSTRHWVAAVQAEAAAGLGQQDHCERALDAAAEVRNLPGLVENGGWLRFDGSRLAEERGTCYATLRLADKAETNLLTALSQAATTRRRAGVLTDLAAVGAQHNDPDRVVAYTDQAMRLARQTGSGVIAHKLTELRPRLAPLMGDRRVRCLDADIVALAS